MALKITTKNIFCILIFTDYRYGTFTSDLTGNKSLRVTSQTVEIKIQNVVESFIPELDLVSVVSVSVTVYGISDPE